jgi:hypothetical protein
LEQQLENIEKSIEKEAKFKDATTRMLSVANGDVKKRAQSELDDCLRRSQTLFEVKENLKKAISAKSMVFQY